MILMSHSKKNFFCLSYILLCLLVSPVTHIISLFQCLYREKGHFLNFSTKVNLLQITVESEVFIGHKFELFESRSLDSEK